MRLEEFTDQTKAKKYQLVVIALSINDNTKNPYNINTASV